MRWRTKTGEEMEAQLGQDNTKDITSQAWRTALDPEGEWIPAVLRSADRRLTEVRAQVPDAGGLVIATDQTAARAYAAILREISGEAPTVVLSDEAEASARIEQFSQGTSRWMVAVRMVSEGVDVPRLAVGVYATSASTPLFFAQAIGRFVRARRRGETASVFLPNVPQLLALAGEMERQRDHALDRDSDGDDDLLDDDLMQAAEREDKASDALTEEFTYQALGSQAHFDRVLYDGREFGQLADPRDPGGGGVPRAPGSARARARPRPAHAAPGAPDPSSQGTGGRRMPRPGADAAAHRRRRPCTARSASSVSCSTASSDSTRGSPASRTARCTPSCGASAAGPPSSQATVAQLQSRIDVLRARVRS